MEQAHFADLCRRAAQSGQACFTRFLEPPLCAQAERIAQARGLGFLAYGGYEGAERTVAAFYGGAPPEVWPIQCLRIDWKGAYATVSHRDILGALMGLRIERSMIGDILMGEDRALAFVMATAAPVVISDLESAGRAKLSVSRCDGEALPAQQGVFVRDTVPSMRLDAVAAAGFGMSRAQARSLIERGLAKLNHLPEERADARVGAGDLISIRGCGRLRIDREQGATRKGRLGVVMTRFGQR
jgi:RNA-binding protein YlmH